MQIGLKLKFVRFLKKNKNHNNYVVKTIRKEAVNLKKFKEKKKTQHVSVVTQKNAHNIAAGYMLNI